MGGTQGGGCYQSLEEGATREELACGEEVVLQELGVGGVAAFASAAAPSREGGRDTARPSLSHLCLPSTKPGRKPIDK